MGRHGALKLAFAPPEQFARSLNESDAEPGLNDAQIGARNRIHHSSGRSGDLSVRHGLEIFVAIIRRIARIRKPEQHSASRDCQFFWRSGITISYAHDGRSSCIACCGNLDISHEISPGARSRSWRSHVPSAHARYVCVAFRYAPALGADGGNKPL